MAKKKTTRHPSVQAIPVLEMDRVKIHNIIDKMERTFLPVGAQIGKYRIIEEIDRGGMAVVYKATQLDLDRVVALKVLPANITINRRFVERFLSEAHAVAKLNHANIVSIHEVSMEDNIYFLAMDHVPGTNLFYFMNQRKPKLVDVLSIFVQLADALSYAHQQRILHRDLKLNNVIMRDNKIPVLIDFGLAKALEEEEDGLTKTGEIMGSPAYMAPERILGSGSDVRSDICSLGIMLYEVLTLKNPYLDPRSLHQTTLNVIEADPVAPRKLVPWLPVEVEAITLKSMHRDPDLRYQTMAEFRDDLIRYQKGEQVIANPPSLWSKLGHISRKYWALISIVATACIFAAALGFVLYYQSRKEQWNWKRIGRETFSDEAAADAFFIYTDPSGIDTAHWRIEDGALRVDGAGFSYLRFERFYTRDLRFEFDIVAVDSIMHDVGFFICGNDPRGGHRFHIHRGIHARNGITYPGSSFLFHEHNPLQVFSKHSYHVVAEKLADVISFKLDGVLVARVYNYFPVLGKNHQKIGFFINGGSFAIDNFSVYRLAMPQLASPTIIADRFWEHGDFVAALEEYKELLLDVSQEEIVHKVSLRMADCLIRLERFEEADALLAERLVMAAKDEESVARILYLFGMLAEAQKQPDRAERFFFDLAKRFPASPVNQQVVGQLVLDALEQLEQDTVGAPEERLALLAKAYPKHLDIIGSAQVEVLRYYAARGMIDKSRKTEKQISKQFEKGHDIRAEAKTVLARLYLGKRKKQDAINLLDQAIAAQEPTAAAWRAWMLLADIYEHNHNYGDAMTIYKKIYDECSPGIPAHWFARIKMGEIAREASYEEEPLRIFSDVVRRAYPFAHPILIAQYYIGALSENDFSTEWQMLSKQDPAYLYYRARKALLDGNNHLAVGRLEKYLAQLSPDSWEYVKAYSLKGFTERK